MAFTDAIAAVQKELSVEVATTTDQWLELRGLAYRVHCEERGLEPSVGGLKFDAFDSSSRHVLVRNLPSGSVLGTGRVVLPDREARPDGLPMRRACDPLTLARLPPASTGEISPFKVTRDRTGLSPAAGALIRVCLFRGIVQVSSASALTHWCALMDPSFLQLLRATGIHFAPVGPTPEDCDAPQPVVCSIGTMLTRAKFEYPAVWAYITRDGLFDSPEHASSLTSIDGTHRQSLDGVHWDSWYPAPYLRRPPPWTAGPT